MENKSNGNLMENQNNCSNSIKNEMLFPLEFNQIDFDWVENFARQFFLFDKIKKTNFAENKNFLDLKNTINP